MAQIWIDDFEGTDPSSGDRSATAHADQDNGSGPALGGNGDYFFRTNLASDAGNGLQEVFSGFNGSFYWRGEDVEDSAGGVNPALGFINWTGIDITGDTGLTFSGLFGARTFDGSNFTFETGDFITVRASIDGGAFVDILSFRGTGVGNAQMAQDSNLDGVINGSDNGVLLSDVLASFTANIAGTGTTLALQLETNVGASEEIAFDDMSVSNDEAGPIDLTAGDDVFTGTAGDDVINALAGNDQVAGGDGADTINGDAGNDFLVGGNGDDILNGGDDNDMLRGDDGADTLNGGNGTDTARYINSAAITIVDGVASTGDAVGDTYSSIERFWFSQFGDSITGISAGDDNYYGFGGDDTIEGGAGADLLVGGSGMDMLDGGSGNDVIIGGDDNDDLFGGSDKDYILGGSGIDRIEGGSGNDHMNGNAGADIYVIDQDDFGTDYILGWEDGTDMVEIGLNVSNTFDFSDLTVSQSGANVMVSFNDASVTGRILILGEMAANITEADFDFITPPFAPPPADELGADDGDIFAGVDAPAFATIFELIDMFDFTAFETDLVNDVGIYM